MSSSVHNVEAGSTVTAFYNAETDICISSLGIEGGVYGGEARCLKYKYTYPTWQTKECHAPA